MQTNIDKEKHNSLFNIEHFVKYVIFGVTSVLFGWIVLIVLVKYTDLDNNIIYYVSGHFGILLSFLLNYNYNFNLHDQFGWRMLQKYLIHLSGIFVGHIFVITFISFFNNNLILTSFFSYFIMFFYQYILNKKLTYRIK